LENKQVVSLCPSQEQYQFLYEALAAAFPVQNGEVTAAAATATPAAAGGAVHIVDETGHTRGEPAGSATTTTDNQQVAAVASSTADGAASTPPAEEQEEAAKTTPVEPASNGSTVTMEV